jgi:catechol 2,3-dioxygenase
MIEPDMEEQAMKPLAVQAPVHVARVGLKARDAERLAAFYGDVLGLSVVRREADVIGLGAGDLELLEIIHNPGLRPDDPREAGLFHIAFLLPARTDLARWLAFAIERGIRLDGVSDHRVSEALYLHDPEGNGIEVYCDRPRSSWPFNDGMVAMTTEPLDTEDLLRERPAGDRGWNAAPSGTVIGHVHLRVGSAAEAEKWWSNELGFATMARYGDAAVFLATGGYHHHVGANHWRSRGAGVRKIDRAGLAFVELATADGTSRRVNDPWGTEIRLVAPDH